MTALQMDEPAFEAEPGPDYRNNILVTGGSGLVGSHVVAQLVKNGRTVKAIYRKEIPTLVGTEGVSWLKGDILDVVWLEEVMKDIDYVYHCAAVVSYSQKKKLEMFQINIDGTANVVNVALGAGVRKLCFVSSVAAIGKAKDGAWIDEKLQWTQETNRSNYGKSKHLAEIEVWRGIGEGLPAVIVNPAVILGAGDWNNSSTKIFKTAYQEFPWYTEGITGFVDVEDVVKAMIQLMESDITGERFVLSAENKRYREIFTMAADAFSKKAPHKKVSRLMANAIWLTEAFKSVFTGREPLLTKETAEAAQSVLLYDNSKLKRFLPSFIYTPVSETIKRVCAELQQKYKLCE
jgi:dihydroflavonol-4-reductase